MATLGNNETWVAPLVFELGFVRNAFGGALGLWLIYEAEVSNAVRSLVGWPSWFRYGAGHILIPRASNS